MFRIISTLYLKDINNNFIIIIIIKLEIIHSFFDFVSLLFNHEIILGIYNNNIIILFKNKNKNVILF